MLSLDVGYQVAQVRIVFSLPKHVRAALLIEKEDGSLDVTIPPHMAYVEWFTPFSIPNTIHGMYKVSRAQQNGDPVCSIIPVSDIRHSVHLIPCFGKVVPVHWTSSNVLEECTSFYVNPFSDCHAYITIT